MHIPFTLSELQKAGLTQTQIGKAIGLRQSAISDMASGKSGIKRPSHQVISGLEKLAIKHGIATDPPPPKRRRVPSCTETPN